MNAGLPLGTMPTSGTWYDVYDGCTLLIDGTVNINCYKDGGWTLESSLLDGWSKEDPFAGQETQVIDYLAIGPNGHMYKVVIDPGIFVGDAGGAASGSSQYGVSGHLATITSEQEDSFLESIRATVVGIVAAGDPDITNGGEKQEFWVGGVQDADEDEVDEGWNWVNGEGPFVYTNWIDWPEPATDEPSDGWDGDVFGTTPGIEDNTENHLTIGIQGNEGWNDESDGGADYNILGYIVEYDDAAAAGVMYLAEKVVELSVQKGIANSLVAKLNAILNTLDDNNANNDAAAINSLEAFINAIYTQLGNGKIPAGDAALALELIADAQMIINLIV